MTKITRQKDQLAKLMAAENITVVHKKIPTAYFDVKNRILACPIFKEDISSELYDLFMGHEVGHALNTPYEGLHSALEMNRTLKGYLNVVEDVRIEKAIKNKFQGLRKSFFTAYNELMEMDFFQLEKRNLSELSLIDKINLQTKVGSRLGLKFTKVEQEFLDMSEACKTWEDVVECATAIYEWSKENETRTEHDEMLVPQMFDLDEDGDEEGDEEESEMEEMENESQESATGEESEEEESEEDSLPELNTESGETEEEEAEQEGDTDDAEQQVKSTGGKEGGKDLGYHDDENGARESITEHAAHNNEEQFLSDENIIKTQINLKEVFAKNDMNEVVLPFKSVLSDWREYVSVLPEYKSQETWTKNYERGIFTGKKIENKNKKIVAHMAKEFEMKQSAQLSKKAFSGKTGKLDMNKLAKYQIVDDIFKRATYLPEGKNHGLTVLLDWSGSICDEVTDLLEQSMILAMFCRKVNIPYRVYLFSDAYSYTNKDEYGFAQNDGKLIEIMSNEMNNRQHKEMMGYLGCIYANYFSQKISWRNYQKSIASYNEFFGEFESIQEDGSYWDLECNFRPQDYRLGGTPLDQTLVALRQLLPEFNAQYGLEKSILTVITDGFSHGAEFLRKGNEEMEDYRQQEKTMEEEGGYYFRSQKSRDMIDPFLNKVFPLESKSDYYGRNGFKITQNLLDWISETTGVIVTGYFVLGRKQDLYSVLEHTNEYRKTDTDIAWREIRKEGKIFTAHGYNKLFLTAANNLGTAGNDELGDEFIDAKKVRVMAAFKRNQKSKTTSRFLTNEFIKEIA